MAEFPPPLRVVYLGAGDIGLPSLEALVSCPDAALVGVITQPDKPSGRSRLALPGPVKTVAASFGIPILQPVRLREPGAVAALRALSPDVLVVMAYGQLLSREVIDLPKVAAINLHASLLPAHRGASPVQAALLAGDSSTGISVMFIDEGLDTGDVLLEKSIPIAPDETGGTLHDKLAQLAPEALLEALRLLREGGASRLPQDAARASHCGKLKKEDGRLDWDEPAWRIERKVRAFSPWPGAFATFLHPALPDIPIKVWRVERLPGAPSACVGHVSGIGRHELVVQTAEEAVSILELQPPGRRRMPVADFLRGLHV